MSQPIVIDQRARIDAWINRAAARLFAFLLTAVASFSMTLSAYSESFRITRTAAVLAALILLHVLRHARFIWRREYTLYACFLIYMFIALIWTRDWELAMNTLIPAINCLLAIALFGSLVSLNHPPAVFAGALFGFAVGAAAYTLTAGFPFRYPEGFSYNAIAGMYLYGLFIALMYSCFRRSTAILLGVAVVIMLHIVATTSIKTNLGIVLGLGAATLVYFPHFGRLLRRQLVTILVLLVALGFAVASNQKLLDRMEGGVKRVSIGVKVLQAREDVTGYSGFGERDYWKQMGIEGWALNPVFGYGTEAFRDDYGITSHSTPIDVLYNFGLIGFVLFYGILASLLWRLLRMERPQLSNQRALILAGVVCYAFVSLSGTMHYNIFLGGFVGISAALLALHDEAAASKAASTAPRRTADP